MANHNLFATLHARGFATRRAPFLTAPGARSRTYGEIDDLSARMAAHFISRGAQRGARICVQVEKSAEAVALYLAALRAGLVYTPLNTAYTDAEVSYFLGDCEPAFFVCAPDRAGRLAVEAGKAGAPATYTLDAEGRGSLIEAAGERPPFVEIAEREEDDLAAIVYTSGTTGRSKGAMLSHGNLVSNALALHKAWGFAPRDVLLHALPIFHVHGLFVALHTAMLSGCEALFLKSFDVAAVRAALERASVMMGVPTFYVRLLEREDFGAEECARMRLFISGSAPLDAATHEAFRMRTGHAILERYGMSEAGMITSNPLHGERAPGSVGYPLPGVEVRVAGAEGALLPAGETGSVQVRGPNVFKGYWRMPDKTREEFRDGGWFVTGDLGRLCEDGRLVLVGREKDLIIAGGYNIYPREIEDALSAAPGVAECAVIGAPHPDMGEGVVAVLVAEDRTVPPQTDGVAQDAGALAPEMEKLAKFKRPRRFVWVDALPRNAMGKVRKDVLRRRYAAVFASP